MASSRVLQATLPFATGVAFMPLAITPTSSCMGLIATNASIFELFRFLRNNSVSLPSLTGSFGAFLELGRYRHKYDNLINADQVRFRRALPVGHSEIVCCSDSPFRRTLAR